MSASLKAQKQPDIFPPTLPQPSHSRDDLLRNPSKISLATSEKNESESGADGFQQSKRVTKANFDEALRNRTVGLSLSDNRNGIDPSIDDQVSSWKSQRKWLV
jgi:hypothetical protein